MEDRDALLDLGWDPEWADAFDGLSGSAGPVPARVTAVHRGRVHVRGEGVDESVPVAGTLWSQPAVGDWVAFDGERVSAILPRRTELAREETILAANVDLGMVVVSLHEEVDLRRMERFVALVTAGGIEPVMVLTKGDLSADAEAERTRVAEQLGIDAIALSALAGWGIEEVGERLVPRRTAAFIGMSGVGKSTLLNALLGEDRQRTLEVRAGDSAGRHATVHRELFALPHGALVIDTPGMRRPAPPGSEGVAEGFADIELLARSCRFADCRHEGEPGCAVRGAVSEERLASFRELEGEGRDADDRAEQRGGRRSYNRPGHQPR
jgi:ribosome biogenesis GTPase